MDGADNRREQVSLRFCNIKGHLRQRVERSMI